MFLWASCDVRNVWLSSVLRFSNKSSGRLRSGSRGGKFVIGSMHDLHWFSNSFWRLWDVLGFVFLCFVFSAGVWIIDQERNQSLLTTLLLFEFHCKVLACLCPPLDEDLCCAASFGQDVCLLGSCFCSLENSASFLYLLDSHCSIKIYPVF